jgi:integrase
MSYSAAGRQWNRSRYREQVWAKSVEAAAKHDRERSRRSSSIYDGFTFHLLRHTADSLMALAGLEPAVACERLGHSDGGALFLKTYHLYEGEKRVQAARSDAMVRASLHAAWTDEGRTGEEGLLMRVPRRMMGAPGIEHPC